MLQIMNCPALVHGKSECVLFPQQQSVVIEMRLI